MNRRRFLGVSASIVVSAGCSELSPVPESGTTRTSHPTPSSTATHDGSTKTPTLEDCSAATFRITNETAQSITVAITITALSGRFRGTDSPTATKGSTPVTDTATETYSETFELGPSGGDNETKTYPHIEARETGWHRLNVSVKDGPENSFYLDLPYGRGEVFRVYIESNQIRGHRSGFVC